MHQLAIALKKKGYQVSGSDDEIFEPSCSNLQQNGLLPSTMGWHPELITSDIEAVILGMHAKADNPVGRKFDFLCQEFNREANTLCSKSADIELTRIGIDLKGAIERMREQVQNVE